MKNLAQQALELCWEIEKFPASEHQTATVLKASALHQELQSIPSSVGEAEPVAWAIEFCGELADLCRTKEEAEHLEAYRDNKYKDGDMRKVVPLYAHPLPVGEVEAQIKHMVSRFLGWRLPENFNPDAGINFKPTFNEHLPVPMKHEPTGTNLFDALQATQMVRYMMEGMPVEAIAAVPVSELEAAAEIQKGLIELRDALIEDATDANEIKANYSDMLKNPAKVEQQEMNCTFAANVLTKFIEAMPAIESKHLTQEGYVSVPREPTEAMIKAGAETPLMKEVDGAIQNAWMHGFKLSMTGESPLGQAYKAMIAAAKKSAAPAASAKDE